MVATYVGKGPLRSNNASPLQVNWPEGSLEGDVAFMTVAISNNAERLPAIKPPGVTCRGWFEVVEARWDGEPPGDQGRNSYGRVFMFWRFNDGKSTPAEIVFTPNDQCLITARIYVFRHASKNYPPYEAIAVSKYFWETAKYPLLTDVPSGGPAIGDGRLAVGFVVTAHGRHCDIVANHSELDDVSTFLENPIRRTNHAAYVQTLPDVVNTGEYSKPTRIIRNLDLQNAPCASIRILLAPSEDTTPSFGTLHTEIGLSGLLTVVEPAISDDTLDYSCEMQIGIRGSLSVSQGTIIIPTYTEHQLSATLGWETYIDTGMLKEHTTDVTVSAETSGIATSARAYILYASLLSEIGFGGDYIIETTALATADDNIPGGGDGGGGGGGIEVSLSARLNCEIGFDRSPDPDLYSNERVKLKSRFLPDATLHYDDFSSLIEFVIPSFKGSLAYLSDKSGLLEAVVTASGFPILDVVPIPEFAEYLLDTETYAELGGKVAEFADYSLINTDDIHITFAGGLSANAYELKPDYNPLKVGIQSVTEFVSASATNVIINQYGRTYYVYCTGQKACLFLSDTGASVQADYTYPVSGSMFNMYYSNIKASEDGKIYVRINDETNYLYVGVSVNGSSAGLILAERNDTHDYAKSGVITGYNVGGNQWYLTNMGGSHGSINVGLARVDALATAHSISIVAQNGSLTQGCVRVISHNVGAK